MIELLATVLVLIFLIMVGFFSGSEMAVLSANQAKLRLLASKGDRRAKLALKLLGKSEVLLATTLVGTNIAMVAGVTLATWLIARWVPSHWNESLVAMLIMTPVILVFAELIPKCIFRAQADSITLYIAGPLRVAQRLLYVIIAIVTRITRMLLWLTGKNGNSVEGDVTRRELKALAQIGEEHGVFAPQTRLMLQSVFDLGDRLVGTVMVPLKRMVAVPTTATVEQVEQLAAGTGYSHFPVYQDRLDNIVGIVNLTDVMCGGASADSSIEPTLSREVTRISPNKSIGALLTEFRYSQVPLAIVVGKDGRALGLLSPQDLLEEIVGTIRDERALEQNGADLR